MKKILAAWLAASCLLATPAFAHKLFLLSVDGLDWRYLRDRDAMALKIPNFRKIMARSLVADGVTGVWPTVTWPSHTSMLTGVPPDIHGILANAGGPPDPALSYWSFIKIKAPTLTQCLATQGKTIGAVNWPVTVNAPINWNLPEVYARRSGDSSDMETVDKFGTAGLVAEVTKADPSFNEEWLDDRARAIATEYILKTKKPDLMLLHLAELDSQQHEEGPFTPHDRAVIERSDALIGDILKVLPKDYDLALVSDHGFEALDHMAALKVMAAADGISGPITIAAGMVSTSDQTVAGWLRGLSGKGDVGREIAHDELVKYAPNSASAVAAFEPMPHVMFSNAASGDAHPKPGEKGNHGFWPTRPDYHSIFLLSGPGVKPGKLPTIEMVSLESLLQAALEIHCP